MNQLDPHELELFVTGQLEDPDALQRIREDLKDPDGEAWKFLRGIESLSETAFRIDWGKLTEETKADLRDTLSQRSEGMDDEIDSER